MTSGGARRPLGWIPFKARLVVWRNGQAHFHGLHLAVWDSMVSLATSSARDASLEAVEDVGISVTVKVKCA
ncbi:hypothetical protein BN2475_1040004 [Paraburkholderia ribeironis]|uniref:Uncharacterized protein n=1 Tax=Paraburkholderia ribeironis TaxID=1247936 RepID=A0A1N7SME6_9BURK|nr:hypothetical protein BN2475_1040004 [Paraburkholderia ribeironis]